MVTDLRRADDLGLDTDRAADRVHALQLLQALSAGGERQAAGDAEPRGLAGFRLQSEIEVGGVGGHPAVEGRAAQGPDHAGRMPSGAAGELVALQQESVAAAELGQVIEGAAADDAATDHHDLGLLRQLHGALVFPAVAGLA